MITILALPRAFAGEFDTLQRNAIASWQRAAPNAQIVLFGNDAGVQEAAAQMGCEWGGAVARGVGDAPLVDGIFAWGEHCAFYEWILFTSSDIIFDSDLTAVVESLQGIPRPFVIGQRRDIEAGDGLSGYVLHPPCGVDYFLYRKGTIGGVLPFTVRGGGGDNWMVWKALTCWQMTVIDATAQILALHMPHSHPEWQSGKIGRERSAEQLYNHALMRADGMGRHYGVDDAPFVLCDGRVTERAKELA